ncbi:hypothetical protein SPYCW_3432 [Sphingopyxis sp. EG6]|nr:hypothetical protein SPYCW_3432 [Sphingopyxis sp. EG6]
MEGHHRFALPSKRRSAATCPESLALPARRCGNRLCPSTTLRVVPLPRWGRISCVRKRSNLAIHPRLPQKEKGRELLRGPICFAERR